MDHRIRSENVVIRTISVREDAQQACVEGLGAGSAVLQDMEFELIAAREDMR